MSQTYIHTDRGFLGCLEILSDLIIVFLYHYFNVSLYVCTRVSLLYSDSVYCFHSITVSPSLCDRYFPRPFVPLPVQAGGRCSQGPVSPSDVCGHRLHRFLQGLEPGPLLGQAARWATSLSEAVRALSIISAGPSLANRLLPPSSSYRLGRTLLLTLRNQHILLSRLT